MGKGWDSLPEDFLESVLVFCTALVCTLKLFEVVQKHLGRVMVGLRSFVLNEAFFTTDVLEAFQTRYC